MRYLIRMSVAVTFLAVFAVSALAGPKISVWKGHISFNSAQIPDPSDPNQQALIAAGSAAEQQTTMKLTLRGDHKYFLLTVVGTTQQTTTGTWTQSGNIVTIQPLQAGTTGTARGFIVSRDARKMSYTQGAMTISFSR